MKRGSVLDRAAGAADLPPLESGNPDHAGSEPKPQMQTAPGAMMSFFAETSGVFDENEALKIKNSDLSAETLLLRTRLEEVSSMPRLVRLDPKQILRSEWANRHEQSFADKDFQELKSEIESSGGNIQPIKVRPIPGHDGKYEIVFGHRRHQACFELGLPVNALLETLDDRELFAQMDRENRSRKDLRPIEQGVMYRKALKSGLFSSARQMAGVIGVNHSYISKALTLADLPPFILSAFESPMDIQFNWAHPLKVAVDANFDFVKRVSLALEAENPKPKPGDIFKRLVATPSNESAGETETHESRTNETGVTRIAESQAVIQEKNPKRVESGTDEAAPMNYELRLVRLLKTISAKRQSEFISELEALLARFS